MGESIGARIQKKRDNLRQLVFFFFAVYKKPVN